MMKEQNNEFSAADIFKCLGNKTRLEIMRILNTGESYVELLASKLDLTAGTVSFHMKKLEEANLVTCSRSQFYMIYSINRNIMNKTIGEFLAVPPDGSVNSDDKYKQAVLSNFIKYGRLKSLPAQRKKRDIILEHIVSEFELGKDYSEKEVNAVIQKFHEDYCTIRREFIASGFMKREREIYTRMK